MNDAPSGLREPSQLLPRVFGGKRQELRGTQARNPAERDLVGIFPNFTSACAAWRAKAQLAVDNALRRYFIVHLHRFLDRASDLA